MSAAAEYYGYLLSQGYGESQIKKFSELAALADKGEISHNQAYRQACKSGFVNAEGEKRSFGDWMATAQEQGWIDKGLDALGSLINKNKGNGASYAPAPTYYPPVSQPKQNNTMLYVIGGVALVSVGVAIYFAAKKK